MQRRRWRLRQRRQRQRPARKLHGAITGPDGLSSYFSVFNVRDVAEHSFLVGVFSRRNTQTIIVVYSSKSRTTLVVCGVRLRCVHRDVLDHSQQRSRTSRARVNPVIFISVVCRSLHVFKLMMCHHLFGSTSKLARDIVMVMALISAKSHQTHGCTTNTVVRALTNYAHCLHHPRRYLTVSLYLPSDCSL